jgi:hypothetical protein
MGRACGMHGNKRNLYGVFIGKFEGKVLLQIPTCQSEDDIKMACKEI